MFSNFVSGVGSRYLSDFSMDFLNGVNGYNIKEKTVKM